MKLSSVSLVATALAAIAGTAIASGPPHEHRQGPAYGGASLAYSGPPPPAHHGSPARHSTPPSAPAQTHSRSRGGGAPAQTRRRPRGGAPAQTRRRPRGGGTPALTHGQPSPPPESRIDVLAKLAAAQESAASAWGTAAKKADRLNSATGQLLLALNAQEYRRKQTKISTMARNHRSDEQYFRENGEAAKPDKQQGHRLKNSTRSSESAKRSGDDAQTTNAILDGHLQSLGINFEAEQELLLRHTEAERIAAHDLLLLHHWDAPTH